MKIGCERGRGVFFMRTGYTYEREGRKRYTS